MLDTLFGNKNVQKVLLFLFVNGKCYGAQLQRLLRTPLTSLQNALRRLEKGKIITAYSEGKTKLYQLNPAYPLLPELEQLLKKGYTFLSPQEKKYYSLVAHDHIDLRSQQPLLLAFWKRLQTVRQLHLHAKSRTKEAHGWTGKGKGTVHVLKENETILEFHEKGSWQLKPSQEVAFTSAYRWTLDRTHNLLSLEHLRLGPTHPVFLFHLAPTGPSRLASVESHLCEEDAYQAQVLWDATSIRLTWRVIGPQKNEEMEYFYF